MLQQFRPLALMLAVAAAAACADAAPSDQLPPGAAGVALAADADVPVLRRLAPAMGGIHDFRTGRPSADGSFLPYVDWTTGDVAIYDFARGASRLLTDKGTWGEDGSWAEGAVASPDGRRVAYLYGNVKANPAANYIYELRVIGADGTGDRVLRTMVDDEVYYYPTDWSERHGILVERNYARTGDGPEPSDLITVDPESGAVRVIIPRTEAHFHRATFSPDEGLVALQQGPAVAIYDLEGREVARAPWGHLLGWTPSGGGLVTYGRHSSGQTGFWHLAFDGQSLAEPELLRGAVYGADVLGAAGDRYFYTVVVDAPQVAVGTLDLRTGQETSTPTPVGTAAEGGTDHPAWSPDGRSLAYLRTALGGATQLMVRSADGGEVRVVAEVDVPQARTLRWHPDGESIYFVGRPRNWVLYRVDLQRGEVSEAVRDVYQEFAFSPDGATVYLRRSGDDWWGGRNGLSAVDLASGEERWFLEGSVGRIATVPDGQVVFAHESDERTDLVVVRPDGTGRRVLATVNRPDFTSPNGSITALGSDVLYTIWRDQDERRELWAVPLQGGESRLIARNIPIRMALHPDGRRFATLTGDLRHEIWVMEGVEEVLAGRR